jgi:hypothetical protein
MFVHTDSMNTGYCDTCMQLKHQKFVQVSALQREKTQCFTLAFTRDKIHAHNTTYIHTHTHTHTQSAFMRSDKAAEYIIKACQNSESTADVRHSALKILRCLSRSEEGMRWLLDGAGLKAVVAVLHDEKLKGAPVSEAVIMLLTLSATRCVLCWAPVGLVPTCCWCFHASTRRQPDCACMFCLRLVV